MVAKDGLFAAALMIADSTYLDGRPFGYVPGVIRNCGTPCYGARWSNPFREAKFGPAGTKSSETSLTPTLSDHD